MKFSREEYWRGLPCPPPGELPNPGIKFTSLISPALVGGFFTTSATWEALHAHNSAQSYMDWMLGDVQTCSDVNATTPVGTGALTNMLDGDTQGAWRRVCRNTLHCLHHSSVCLKFFKELHRVTHGIHTPLTPARCPQGL